MITQSKSIFKSFFTKKPLKQKPLRQQNMTLTQQDAKVDAKVDAEQISDNAGDLYRKMHPTDETGGPKGLEPTRYGDWEKAGRCSDF